MKQPTVVNYRNASKDLNPIFLLFVSSLLFGARNGCLYSNHQNKGPFSTPPTPPCYSQLAKYFIKIYPYLCVKSFAYVCNSDPGYLLTSFFRCFPPPHVILRTVSVKIRFPGWISGQAPEFSQFAFERLGHIYFKCVPKSDLQVKNTWAHCG